METYTNSFAANWHLSGNAIVGAFPMVALGYYIHLKEGSILKISGKIWLGLLIISYGLMFVTVNYRFFGLDISQIFKISTAMLSFICCINYKNVLRESFLTRLGKEGSLYIYIYHFLIGVALKDILLYNGVAESFITTFFPWIVVSISIAVSYCIVILKNRAKCSSKSLDQIKISKLSVINK